MSRYIHELTNGKTVVWGYDEPLNEYFIQLHKAHTSVDEDDDGIIFSIANWHTMVPHPHRPDKFMYSNSELLDILEGFNVAPEEHLEAISMDIPF